MRARVRRALLRLPPRRSQPPQTVSCAFSTMEPPCLSDPHESRAGGASHTAIVHATGRPPAGVPRARTEAGGGDCRTRRRLLALALSRDNSPLVEGAQGKPVSRIGVERVIVNHRHASDRSPGLHGLSRPIEQRAAAFARWRYHPALQSIPDRRRSNEPQVAGERHSHSVAGMEAFRSYEQPHRSVGSLQRRASKPRTVVSGPSQTASDHQRPKSDDRNPPHSGSLLGGASQGKGPVARLRQCDRWTRRPGDSRPAGAQFGVHPGGSNR